MARFRFGALFALALGIAIFSLLVRDGNGARMAELLATGAGLVIAVVTSGAPRRTRRGAGILVSIAVGVVAATAVVGNASATLPLAATAVLVLATIVVVSGGLIRLVVDRGVDLTAVFGALTVYLLVGLMFGFLVGAFATGIHGDYFVQGTDGTQSDRVYFSFTTMTTTGYGDLTARTRGGHSLAVLEMLIGQLYLVTVIALLVSNLRHDRVDAPSPARGDARSPRD